MRKKSDELPKNVEIEMTQKPLDPYAAFEKKPVDSPTPENVTTIRGALSLIDREGGSMENLPGAFRMPLPLALNSVEEAAQQDRISRRQRRKFSAKREGEIRVSLGAKECVNLSRLKATRSGYIEMVSGMDAATVA